QGGTAFVVPPKSVWPPVGSPKVRWKGAKFIPIPLVESLLNGGVLEEDRWSLDGQSECLVPHGHGGPFRIGVRSSAAVDRRGAGAAPHATACLEFSPGAGFWAAIWFDGEDAKARWLAPLKAAFRLLADSGFGGERSRGWGRSEPPEFIAGALPDLVFPPAKVTPIPEPIPAEIAPEEATGEPDVVSFWSEPPAEAGTVEAGTVEAGTMVAQAVSPAVPEPVAPAPISQPYWLLSLFVPTEQDTIEWERGNYSVVARGGRVESPVRSGDLKKLVNMISEGSVVFAGADPQGAAPDVAPHGFPHPVYRSGFAVAIPIPQAPS